MRHRPLEDAVRVEDDSIRPRAPAGVWLICSQDGELLIRAGTWEAEAFEVVVRVRVAIGADRLTLTVVVATLVHGIVDIGLPVTHAAASVDTGLALCTQERASD